MLTTNITNLADTVYMKINLTVKETFAKNLYEDPAR
jgi:hypothetical protein